jgi:hypothetical protein
MQKRTLFALAQRGLLALLGFGIGGVVTPTLAGVFQASTDVSAYYDSPYFTPFSLPKYSGPGRITGVTLTLTGSAQATIFYTLFEAAGATIAPLGSTENFVLLGPPAGSDTAVLDLSTSVNYPGVSIAPCSECGLGSKDIDIAADPSTFLGSVNLTDFSDFAGSGSNDFGFIVAPEFSTESIVASGTVTETIFTSVPEPSTSGMMLAGFAGLGWLARMRRMAA